ncbi:isochorismate synthase [Aquimarina amphilecti]|uniref:isochorismate synthase n=1 Tax=Aquimarina amphilecti TaxID=1038014 RepID=A0A1H7I3J1_AQUAM|nr:chorismate-binding protein [Aquimarina amphilecti]SEK56010.1 isochorismate synthase [Aquimarina amphilecti]
MDISALYLKIQSHLDDQLPFVVYKKSEEEKLNCFLQNDNLLYELDSYNTSGFVFAPFDNRERTILIPKEKSKFYSVSITSNNETEHGIHDRLSYSVSNSVSKENYLQLVSNSIQAIEDDFFKKVVVSRKEKVSFSNKNPLKIFQRLIKSYSSAFVYLWYHPAIGIWLGATPETLMTIREDEFSTMALAGTQPYVDSLEVKWGAKEIEEQSMVTDFVLNELSPKVDRIERSKTYTYRAGSLLHLKTDIKGVLKNKESDINDVISVIHPTPAVCGLPKERAKSFILENEYYERKYYTGFLGELLINHNGSTESNLFVNLRCMEMDDDSAILYVGGGITKDSIPEMEWEETVRKTETMKKVLY